MRESMSYIARADCGCVVAAISDEIEHRKVVASAVSNWVKRGYAIERVSDQYVRDHLNFGKCPHVPAQQQLFSDLR
jgi:hypothetical protein